MAELDRGGRTEEVLREYFIRAGYFVVRGGKIVYDGDTVTDVDLWLYSKPSALSRERTNVDVKDRDRPRALERVLWALGVQQLAGSERVVVATSDKRASVKSYAARHGVDVLDGDFLKRLGAPALERLHEDELLEIIGPKDEKILGDWRVHIESSKTRLVGGLDFGVCNALTEECRFFLDHAITSHRRDAAARGAYLSTAYLLISLDYSSRMLAFEESDARREALVEGFRYSGDPVWKNAVDLAARIAETFSKGGSALRAKVLQELQNVPVEMLAEHFCKHEVLGSLFDMAKRFEAAAYDRKFIPPGALPGNMQGVLGILLDFSSIEREDFFGRF